MNVDRILQLASLYEKPTTVLPDGTEVRLDMGKFGEKTECGTVACIAGTAVLLWEERHRWVPLGPDETGPECECLDVDRGQELVGTEVAREILDLTNEQSRRLFYPLDSSTRHRSREEAAAVLRRLAETGDVEWQP